MSIIIECPSCRTKTRVSDDLAGRKTKCAECGERIDVPDPQAGDSEGTERAPDRRSNHTQPAQWAALLDFILFRRMISTWLLTGAYWSFVVLAILGTLAYSINWLLDTEKGHFGHTLRSLAIDWIILAFALVGLRVFAEMAIVFFHISDALNAIRRSGDRRE